MREFAYYCSLTCHGGAAVCFSVLQSGFALRSGFSAFSVLVPVVETCVRLVYCHNMYIYIESGSQQVFFPSSAPPRTFIAYHSLFSPRAHPRTLQPTTTLRLSTHAQFPLFLLFGFSQPWLFSLSLIFIVLRTDTWLVSTTTSMRNGLLLLLSFEFLLLKSISVSFCVYFLLFGHSLSRSELV